MSVMRSYEEINVDIAEATQKLRGVNLQIDQIPPVGHNSPVGREFQAWRQQLTVKLRDLRAELLATANDELRRRREGTFNLVGAEQEGGESDDARSPVSL